MIKKQKSFYKFFGIKFLELQKLIQSIKHFGLFSPIIRYWAFSWLVYSLFYPPIRFIQNKEKSILFCDSLLKSPFKPQSFSFHNLMKSKISLKEKADWDLFIEIYLRNVYNKEVLKNGMNIVDIGSHVGLYTVLAAEKVGNKGKVVAVEPAPQNYERLLENIKINNFNNVIPVKMALSDHEGLEKLYITSFSGWHSLDYNLILSQINKFSQIEVNVNTLDKLLEDLNLKKIDIIKIDAEGSEMKILKGAEKTLKNNPNLKIFVASYHYSNEVKEVRDFLNNMGFRTKVSLPDIVITI